MIASYASSSRTRVTSLCGCSMGGCGAAFDQIADAVRQWGVVDHEEQPAAQVLADCTARRRGCREGAFLVHVAEDGIVMAPRRGDADFCVIAVGVGTAFQTEGLPVPLSAGGNLDRPGCAESGIPAADGRCGGRV